jgi:hypothetical protein
MFATTSEVLQVHNDMNAYLLASQSIGSHDLVFMVFIKFIPGKSHGIYGCGKYHIYPAGPLYVPVTAESSRPIR